MKSVNKPNWLIFCLLHPEISHYLNLIVIMCPKMRILMTPYFGTLDIHHPLNVSCLLFNNIVYFSLITVCKVSKSYIFLLESWYPVSFSFSRLEQQEYGFQESVAQFITSIRIKFYNHTVDTKFKISTFGLQQARRIRDQQIGISDEKYLVKDGKALYGMCSLRRYDSQMVFPR